MACGCNVPKVKPAGTTCGCRPRSLPRARLVDSMATLPVMLDRADDAARDRVQRQTATLAEVMDRTDYPPPRELLAKTMVQRNGSACRSPGPYDALVPTLVESPEADGVGRVIREVGLRPTQHDLRLQVLTSLWELTSVDPAQAPPGAPVACDPCEPAAGAPSARLTCESQTGPEDESTQEFVEPPQQEQGAGSDPCNVDPCSTSAMFGNRPIFKASEAGQKPAPSCPTHEPPQGEQAFADPVAPDIRGKGGGAREPRCPCRCYCAVYILAPGWREKRKRRDEVAQFTFPELTLESRFWRQHTDMTWLLRNTGDTATMMRSRAGSFPGSDGFAMLAAVGDGFVPSATPLVEGADLGPGRFTALDLTALQPMASKPAEFALEREYRPTFVSSSHPDVGASIRVPMGDPMPPEIVADLETLASGARTADGQEVR